MKPKSASGITCLVKDLNKTVDFYEKLGFDFKKSVEGVSATGYLNWFWIEFLLESKVITETFKEDVSVDRKGAGQYVYLSVENVDDFYEYLLGKGLKPLSEPQDYPWGNREFVILDPDGYKLVIFKKK